MTSVRLQEPDRAFGHHTLSRSTPANDEVDFARVKLRGHVFQHMLVPKRLRHVVDFNHRKGPLAEQHLGQQQIRNHHNDHGIDHRLGAAASHFERTA